MIATVVQQNSLIVQKFDGVDGRLAENAAEIRRLDKRLDRAERELAGKVDSIVDAKLDELRGHPDQTQSLQQAQGAATSTKQSRETDSYWLARRSLRFAPVTGRDLKRGVIDFVEDNLETDAAIIEALPATAFRRPPTNRNSTVKEEVVVVFRTLEDRDYLRSLSYRLAGKQGVSMRLELPNHLLGQHRVLGKAGQKLRSSNAGSRTNVKYDDDNLRLVLDFKLKDGDWERLTPDQAANAVGDQPRGGATKETTADNFKKLLLPTTGSNSMPLGE
jgi:hypothetical protein